MDRNKFLENRRSRRKIRVRKRVVGSVDSPRLTVFRSLRHMYAQVIDDANGVTLVAASTVSEKIGEKACNVDAARKVGEAVARKAMDVGIHKVKFDRNGYKYHGRVKALADAARKGGLAF